MFSSSLLTLAIAAAPALAALSCTFEYNGDGVQFGIFTYAEPFTSKLWAGFNGTYTAADALAEAGSSASPPSGNPLALAGVGGFPFFGDNFRAYACDSTFMGYPATATGTNGLPIQYGQLAYLGYDSDGNPTDPTCVTLFTATDGTEIWVNEPCSTTDDASLLTQFFEFAVVSDGIEDEVVNVTFLGAPKGGAANGRYFFPGGDEYSVLLSTTIETQYFAKLEYIHTN